MKLISKLSAIGLALLGVGCSSDEPGNGGLCMYGTPIGSFKIKGKVTSEDGKAVAGATIRVTDSKIPSGVWSYGEVVTGSDGEYEVENTTTSPGDMKVVCLPATEEKLDADSIVTKMEYKGGNKDNIWNVGHADATVDFNLKKKSEE